ncbi:hypothetical protein [Bacillus cereus]
MRCFKGRQFKKGIILVGASYYCRFGIWMRPISELMENAVISIVQWIKMDTHCGYSVS